MSEIPQPASVALSSLSCDQYKFRGNSPPIRGGSILTSLAELESQGCDDSDEPVFYCSTKTFLVCKILYYKVVNSDNRKGVFHRLSQNAATERHYDKTMTVMDLNSPPGRNAAIILLNDVVSDRLFGHFLAGRDHRNGFVPGAIIVVSRPNPIDHYFGENAMHGLPVLRVTCGLKLLDTQATSLTIPSRPSESTSRRLQAFFYPRVKIQFTNMGFGHTPCCGWLCDSIGLKKDEGANKWKGSCPCYNTSSGIGQVLFDFNLHITVLKEDGTPTGTRFISKNFTSRHFTHLLTVAGIPGAASPSLLEVSGVDCDIFDKVDKFVSHVNDKLEGFNVLGWARLGHQKDATLKGADNPDKKKDVPKVASGTLIHHVTHIGINGDASRAKDLLIDVSEMMDSCDKL